MVSSLVPVTSTAQPGYAVRFPSLAGLYADPRRRRSRERDVGLRWRSRDGSTYRAAWIEETEELYAVEHLDGDGRGGSVRILARVPAAVLERALRGWPDECGRPASYEWLCWQLRRYRRR
ncbi:hypothetical protein [Conexibacter woesei]|uniref:Uncharacterized protein n=1 Tax=Conexibacter woesei (strain DSM 14684 / CCUG 47730 / CIP 108061 / JCM 11494 / NBRC 100937 / ID131577) TaxID=469383 RepID=D3F829_CONWI|nr:hypothetical protein [Conexibacter woesei]ADB52923.1 hypothetical protein Cwoe_4510 [Conexibacter woesei DSM 14684]